MKKILLMLFAISAVGYGAPPESEGDSNNNKTYSDQNEKITTSSSINVNISATVIDAENNELVITDKDGKEITSINFKHDLIAGSLAGQVEGSHSYGIRTQSNLIDSGNLTIKVEDVEVGEKGHEYELKGDNTQSIIVGDLFVILKNEVKGDGDEITKYKEGTISSIIKTSTLVKDTYSTVMKTVTMTLEK